MNYRVIHTGSKLDSIQKTFIERLHYSGTARSQLEKYVFELLDDATGEVIGIAVFGMPCGSKVAQKYGDALVELRRFVLVDDTERNAESWFLSRCMKQLRFMGVKRIITYADPNTEKQHAGTIYKATNFKYLGEENNNPRVVIYKKMKYTIREVYQKRKGSYTPKALEVQTALRTGKAKLIKQKRKLVFLKELL